MILSALHAFLKVYIFPLLVVYLLDNELLEEPLFTASWQSRGLEPHNIPYITFLPTIVRDGKPLLLVRTLKKGGVKPGLTPPVLNTTYNYLWN